MWELPLFLEHFCQNSTRVAFLTAALGTILKTDNLREEGNYSCGLVLYTCTCKSNGELVDLLLICCPIAMELWDKLFCLFGVTWVMPVQ